MKQTFGTCFVIWVVMSGGLLTDPPCAMAASAQVFYDQTSWDDAVPVQETLDFTGFSDAEWLSDQYADQGVTFSGTSQIVGPGGQFPNDGWGVWGIGGSWVHFDEPMNWIGAHHPGSIKYRLFLGETLVYESPSFIHGGSNIGNFSGVMLDIDFDTAWIHRSGSSGPNSFYDDLHYGNWAMVPAPGALAMFGLAAFGAARRRRA